MNIKRLFLFVSLFLTVQICVFFENSVLAQTVVTDIAVEDFPCGVGVNPSTNRIYVSYLTSENISVIDGSTNQIINTIAVGSLPKEVGVISIFSNKRSRRKFINKPYICCQFKY